MLWLHTFISGMYGNVAVLFNDSVSVCVFFSFLYKGMNSFGILPRPKVRIYFGMCMSFSVWN